MTNKFDINLPSIPSKITRFKIQDIKKTAFGSQKSRFKDMKSLLTNKFIDSFDNFHSPQSLQMQTQSSSILAPLLHSDVIEKQPQKFRTMIPQHKQHLVPLFSERKIDELSSQIQQIPPLHKGYTFMKSKRDQISIEQISEEDSFEVVPQTFTDNYYFNPQQQKSQEILKRKAKPSAVFKNEQRQRQFERIIKNSVSLGPGAYTKDRTSKKVKLKNSRLNKSEEKIIRHKNLKDIISKVVQVPEEGQILQEKSQQKMNKNYMFMNDDRDRFGNQKFPIAQKVNIPGPGAYQFHNSIADRAKKVKIVEEQRKLLKQWFKR